MFSEKSIFLKKYLFLLSSSFPNKLLHCICLPLSFQKHAFLQWLTSFLFYRYNEELKTLTAVDQPV